MSTYTNPLNRLYDALTAATGIARLRDPRLELIAMDRAYEARHQVGTTGSTGIPHPTAQLIARTWPLQDATKAVHENAVWSYETDWQEDFVPQAVEAWMNSPVHADNLKRATDTHWGIGLHIEPAQGTQINDRIYAITVFTEGLTPMPRRRITLQPGTYSGIQFTASGRILDTKTSTLPATSGSIADLRWDVPGLGPHWRVNKGIWAHYWLPESAAVQPDRL